MDIGLKLLHCPVDTVTCYDFMAQRDGTEKSKITNLIFPGCNEARWTQDSTPEMEFKIDWTNGKMVQVG
jgi:hypothetical protein